MTAAALRLGLGFPEQMISDLKRLRDWFLLWVLLPNLPFIMLWAFGSPPRRNSILVMALFGLAVQRLPRPVQIAVWLVGFGFMCLHFISALFNLSIYSLAYSLRFAGELQINASPHYLAAAVILAVVIGTAIMRLRPAEKYGSLVYGLIAIIIAFGVTFIDHSMTYESRGSYKQSAAEGTPWEAGIQNVDIEAAIAARRNVVVVMVESVGVPTDPRVQRMLSAPFRTSAITSRYDVSTGTVPYFGSTTSGEIRELCGRWGEYHGLQARQDDGCLPARLRDAGYDTTAVHSFTGRFFEREDWYPNIGFDQSIFGRELIDRGARLCPGVFAGACDNDVAAMLDDELIGNSHPQFLYFLTVNTHLPVIPDENMATENCEQFDVDLQTEYPMICRLMASYTETARELAEILTDERLGPTDVLIVGDHMPPFYERSYRRQFSTTHVPWIVLRHRG